MRRFPLFSAPSLVIAALVGFVALATAAYAQTFITFDVSNATSTQPAAINAAGEITGSYVDAIFAQHGFLRHSDGTLTTFDAPAHPSSPGQLVLTGATSINAAGQIAGFVYPVTDFASGFLRLNDGTFVDFGGDCFGPNATTNAAASLALPTGLVFFEGSTPTGINNSGQITGVCGPGAGINFGFLRQTDGTVTVFDAAPHFVPNPSTLALAINSRGQITGAYLERFPTNKYRGCLREIDGTIRTFDATNLNVQSTIATAINSRGQVTGYADHAFLRQPNGSLVTFDAPNAISTQPTAINPRGDITGAVLDATNTYHGFLRDKHVTLTTFDVPNATNTYATGINPRGDITGWYSDAGGVHGFVLRP